MQGSEAPMEERGGAEASGMALSRVEVGSMRRGHREGRGLNHKGFACQANIIEFGLGLSRRTSWRRSDLSQGRGRTWKAGREGEVWLF